MRKRLNLATNYALGVHKAEFRRELCAVVVFDYAPDLVRQAAHERPCEAGDAEAAQTQFHLTERSVRRAASNGIIPKKRADRQLSRLAQRLNALGQSS